LADARLRFSKSGFEVQTVRLATPPFLDVLGDPDEAVLLDFAQNLENLAKQYNIEHVSIGPGVMLPVLEDNILAQRAEDGTFSLDDLLQYSAVCGTGLDMVPIPGDTRPEQIASIFLDVAALAVTLNKPLTARLLPIPGKVAGQTVSFDSEYFTEGYVLPVKNFGAKKLFAKSSFLSLTHSKTPSKGFPKAGVLGKRLS